MLLRSASSPLLGNSWVLPPLEVELVVAKTHLSSPISFSSTSTNSPSGRRSVLTRALSESDLSDISPVLPKRNPLPVTITLEEEGEEEEEEIEGKPTLSRLLSSSGLEGGNPNGVATEERVGGGGGDGDAGRVGFSDPNNGAADAYYRRMIEADPSNSLLLGNYANFLKEVLGDELRALEYCERAILANPGDGSILALYADLVWQTSKDADRAESYYDRAVQAAPDDCYVMASYARFLWDVEDDEESVGVEEKTQFQLQCPLIQGAGATPSPIAAAS
ncbi:uncharacterized protein [Typha latifolia]|uniref:uncharacterized protein n=1 Tax=Typha latifolia TaxID=4733 RepID=UPI003C2C53D4